ncbi:MAG: isochorismatase family protein, partial [Candidatus Binatia bacterium]
MEEKIKRRLLHAIVIFVGSFITAMAVGELAVTSYAWAQTDQTIIEEWASVKAPPPPALKAVTIDPKETAFLILDIQKQNCITKRRPRCVASVPKIQKLLTQARAGGLFVVYSLAGRATPADILPEVAPLGGDPVVRSGADKFQGTELEKILKDKGVKTVIAVGTSANGAVLQTSTTA